MLPNQKHPPTLESMLTAGKRPLTPAQQQAQFYMIVSQFKGKTQKTKLRKQVDANGRTVYVERRGK